MLNILDQDVMYLPGVGPKKKEILSKELGIQTWRDLLEHFPYKYVDRSRIYRISEISGDMPFVQIRGRMLGYDEYAMAPARSASWATSAMAMAWSTSCGFRVPNISTRTTPLAKS